MSRVIKFRGMDLEGGWFYGLPCIITVGRDRGSYISNSVGSPMAYDIRPETLTQFTGLLDKNGKEIYEGDIVKSIIYAHEVIGIIEWCNEGTNNIYSWSLKIWR